MNRKTTGKIGLKPAHFCGFYVTAFKCSKSARRCFRGAIRRFAQMLAGNFTHLRTGV